MSKKLQTGSIGALIGLCLVLASGCSQPGTPTTQAQADSAPAAEPAYTQSETALSTPASEDTTDNLSDDRVTSNTESVAALPALVSANNAFGLDLYAYLRDRPGNVFFSPHSIATAFAMTYAGARGNTATQMADTLRIPAGDVHAASARLHDSLRPVDDSYELRIANRLWAQQGFDLLDTYRQVTSQFYGAELMMLDFVGDTEQSRQTINVWVRDQTNDKIPELIPRNAITTLTRLVLTNAVYFKGTWLSQFDESATRSAAFYGSVESQVPMMYQRAGFPYTETASFQALRLPYEGDALSMLVILPRERGGLEALEESLDAAGIQALAGDMYPVEVDVWLPRFSASSQFKLNQLLMDLGMTDAFSPGLADFSGIGRQEGLHITEAIHKALVEVNEEGSEAAAATAVVMGIESESRTITFRADHPFIFMIMDDRSGAVLFLGKLVNPEP